MSDMSRRDAVRSVVTTALGVAGAAGMASWLAHPPRVHASHGAGTATGGKSGLDPIILGEGEHRYEVIHDWGTLPQTHAWGNTHGVCQDAAGNIYIKHTVHASSSSPDAIVVFDPMGKFVRSFGAEYKGGAHGLHYSMEEGDEFLYMCDPNRGLVEKTTLDGRSIWRKTCPMESGLYANPSEYKPTNIAVVSKGVARSTFFIADGYGKSWIHAYNLKGDYVRSFGGPGKERGQVSCPHGLMIDQRDPSGPRLVVADRSNKRLQYFHLDGRHAGFVTENLKAPCHFDQRGNVLLVPDLSARVTLLDKDDKLICHLGDGDNYGLRDQPRDKFVPGKFIAPHSAIFTKTGDIMVVEWVEVGRVTLLRKV